MDTVKIGNFIKELRKEKGFTQKELADRLFITDRAVSKWERGLSAPDISLLEPLSDIFDVSINELITGQRNEAYTEDNTDTLIKEMIVYSNNEINTKLIDYKKGIIIKILKSLFAAVFFLMIAIQIGGDGFGIGCIPAYLHLEKTTNAIEKYDEDKINRYIYNAKEMDVYNKLIALREEGIDILDRDAELFKTKLDDGFMFTQANIVIRHDGIDYMVYFTGTYRNGKTELMYIDGVIGKTPECIEKLKRAICTYNPG